MNNNEKKAGRIIFCLVLVIIAVFALAIKAAAQPEVGYHIVTEVFKPIKVNKYRVQDAAKVDSILSAHIGHKIEVEKLLKDSPFHYCEEYNRAIYVKKMRVVERNGKLKFRRWKNGK